MNHQRQLIFAFYFNFVFFFAFFCGVLMRRPNSEDAHPGVVDPIICSDSVAGLFLIWYCRRGTKPRCRSLLMVLRISFVITYFTGWRQLWCRGNNVTVFIIFSIIVVILWISGLIQITGASMDMWCSIRSIAITRQYFHHGFHRN